MDQRLDNNHNIIHSSKFLIANLPKDKVAFDEIANRVVAPNVAVKALACEFLVIL